MKNIFLKFIYFLLANFARRVIKRHRPFVIGITGSVGKTSAKEAIYQVLADEFGAEVAKTPGNLNAEIGIPLTILGFDSVPNKFFWIFFLAIAYIRSYRRNYPKYLVLEIGVEHPGDIQYFSTIIQPSIGVITSVSPAHLANFRSEKALQEEKISLKDIIAPEGKMFLNIDDPVLSNVRNDRTVTVGILNRQADYRADTIQMTLQGTEYRIETTGQKIAVKSKLIGKQLIYSQLFAFAIGQSLGIQSLKIKKSLEKLTPVNGRMRIIEGKNNIVIIDDSYNANPSSMKAALETLSQIKYSGRKVAILGNMNELGSIEKQAHFEIGKFAYGKCDLAVFVTPNAEVMADGYNDKQTVLTFNNRSLLLKSIDGIIKPNDLILIKASQNKNFFEEIVKYLMKNPENASGLLVRQDGNWLYKK